jgi:hypothetical protein
LQFETMIEDTGYDSGENLDLKAKAIPKITLNFWRGEKFTLQSTGRRENQSNPIRLS